MSVRINIKISFLTIILFVSFGCNSTHSDKKSNSITRIWNFDKIDALFHKNNDTTYVINFWATTCPPCIKELPYFEKLNKLSESQALRVILINRDLEKHFDKRVIPFIQKHHIKSKIIALHDENMSKWLDAVYSKWWGALPFTIIYKGKNKQFYLDPFENYSDLEREVLSVEKK